jgi:DNA-binding NarL/FixJ family response regulator
LLTIGCREPLFELDAKSSSFYRRIANHLGAAFRCRRKLAELESPTCDVGSMCVSAGAEAILDVDWRFVHATGAAQTKTARERIRAAATAIDAARTQQRRTQGEQALDAWHPLTGACWSIVDRFEEQGRRYVVAQENQMSTPGFDLFTDRERQVVVHAALGLTNKQIAYTLGISDVTVRVLMARAAKRLGVRTRKGLLEHPAVDSLRGGQTREGTLPRSGSG